jgi:hypothetical protein
MCPLRIADRWRGSLRKGKRAREGDIWEIGSKTPAGGGSFVEQASDLSVAAEGTYLFFSGPLRKPDDSGSFAEDSLMRIPEEPR